MNTPQKIVAVIGAAIAAWMLAYPPYIRTAYVGSTGNTYISRQSVFESVRYQRDIKWDTQASSLLIVAVMTGCGLAVLRARNKL